MTQNIERVLERGEKLDDLVDKTEDLEASVGLRIDLFIQIFKECQIKDKHRKKICYFLSPS
jgi:hypothetical protein